MSTALAACSNLIIARNVTIGGACVKGATTVKFRSVCAVVTSRAIGLRSWAEREIQVLSAINTAQTIEVNVVFIRKKVLVNVLRHFV